MGSLSHGDRTIRSVIVDDDEAIGGILRELISRDDVSVEVFSNSRKAVEAISKKPADIVITDLMMETVGGLEVLCCSKKANADAVVIIITGHASLDTAIEAVREGAYDYIKKPFKLREIELVFDKAVEKVRLVQKNEALIRELKEIQAQLAVAKKENHGIREQSAKRESSNSPLRFYSTSTPNLEFFQKHNERKNDLYQRLEKIAHLKKDGLLTDREFNTIKGHIFKSLKRFET